jgi:hypothetical protein
MAMSIAWGPGKIGYEFTTDGLTKLSVGGSQYNVNVSGTGNTIQLTATQSLTITHCTNIVGFTPDQIGTFAETTGELADVYNKDGVPYVPTLDRATDAICRVKHTNALSSKIVGIITDSQTMSSHGDLLCVVANDDQYSIKYEVGQLLVPDTSGLCRIAQEADLMFAMLYQIRLPKITWIMPNQKFVGCFIAKSAQRA